MSAFQLTSIVGVPLAVLFVTVVLLAFARPDRDEDNGAYAAYLALASVFSLFVGLLAVAALGEAITQHLVVGDSGQNDLLGGASSYRTFISLTVGDGPSTIAAFATLSVLMAAAFSYHARRRTELAVSKSTHPGIGRIDRAYRGAVCFAMLTLIAIGALVAGAAGYDFFAEKIGSTDKVRDLAMGSFIAYGGLVLVAGWVFRMNVWGIRGGGGPADEADDDEPELADVEDAR